MPTDEKVFEVSLAYYDTLKKLARQENIDGAKLPVFRGSLMQVWRDVSPSQSYWTPVMTFLRDYGYISLLQRGSRGRESVVVFHKRPQRAEISQLDLTEQGEAATIREELRDIQKRLGGLDIVEALRNVEERLQVLEGEANGKATKATKATDAK